MMKGFTNEISSTRKILSVVEAAVTHGSGFDKWKRKEKVMTNNQIAYQRNLEEQRSNRAREGLESSRQDIDKSHYERMDAESKRHNLQDESIRNRSNVIANNRLAEDILNHRNVERETMRSNLERERLAGVGYQIQSDTLQENLRHNRATEDLGRDQLTQRYVDTGAGALTSLLKGGTIGALASAGSKSGLTPAILAAAGLGAGAYAIHKAPTWGAGFRTAIARAVTKPKLASGGGIIQSKERS